jgi:hypothetical protein
MAVLFLFGCKPESGVFFPHGFFGNFRGYYLSGITMSLG